MGPPHADVDLVDLSALHAPPGRTSPGVECVV